MNKVLNHHQLDIDNEFLYVNQQKYNSRSLHNSTPYFVKAILGSTIVVANLAELNEDSIKLWYNHHPDAARKYPEIFIKTIQSFNTLNDSLQAFFSITKEPQICEN